jgi:hypothetical protein
VLESLAIINPSQFDRKTFHDHDWESPEKLKEFKDVDLADFVKSDLGSYASKHHNVKLTIKYLDPKKAIRACPPNAEDASFGH